MNTEMLLLPAKKPVLEGMGKTKGKIDPKIELDAFKIKLQDAKSLVLSKDTHQKSKEVILNDINQLMTTLSKGLSEKGLSDKTKADMNQLVSLLKTIKNEIKDGQPVHLVPLLSFLGNTSTSTFLNADKKTQDTHLQKIFDDFKKKMGIDLPPFFQGMIQAMITTFGIKKDEPTQKSNPSQIQSFNQGKGHSESIKPVTHATSSSIAPHEVKKTQQGKVILEKPLIQNSHQPEKVLTQQGETKVAKKTIQNQWVAGGPMHKVQQFVLHTTVKPQASASVQVTDHIREVISKGIIKPLPSGGLELSIKLHPANLGTIHVVLTETDAGLQATLSAQNQMTKDLLQSQLSHLKQSLGALGINVQKIDVGQLNLNQQNPSQYSGQAFQQPNGESGNGQRQSREDTSKSETGYFDSESGSSFEDWLKEGGIVL